MWLTLSYVLAAALAACTAASPPERTEDEGGAGGNEDEEFEDDAGGGSGGVPPASEGGSAGTVPQAERKDGGSEPAMPRDAAAQDAATPGAAYDPCPAKGTACRVMPLGDSITEAFQYRVALFRKAKAANRSLTYVGSSKGGPALVDGVPFPQQHEGHSGYMVDGIAGLISESLAANDPHIVLLMIGTNDAHRSNQVATAPDRLGKLVDTITEKAPKALIVVAKLIPTSEIPGSPFYSAGNNQRVETFNAALTQKLAPRIAAGKHVVVVDMYAAFTANPDYKTAYFADHLHPSGAGYAVMADVWWQAISPVLK